MDLGCENFVHLFELFPFLRRFFAVGGDTSMVGGYASVS
jgi:hypothetical protein